MPMATIARPKRMNLRTSKPQSISHLGRLDVATVASARLHGKRGWRVSEAHRIQLEWLVDLRMRDDFAELGQVRTSEGVWVDVPATAARLLHELVRGSTAELVELTRLHDLWFNAAGWRGADASWPGP